MKRIVFIGISLLAYVLGQAAQTETTWASLLTQKVAEQFSREYSLPESQVRVQIKGLPDFKPYVPEKVTVNVLTDNKPGFQTVWVEVYEQGIYRKKYPVAVKVSATVPVVAAAGKIARNKILTEKDLKLKTVVIDRDMDSVFRSRESLIGYQARHVIQPGTVLKTNMVSTPYAILRGEQVCLKIMVGNLVVETDGIAQTSGQKGDPVRVRSLATGKTIRGYAGDNKEVLVQMKGYSYETNR